MRDVFQSEKNRSLEEIQEALEQEALQVHREDVEINRRIGVNGQQLLSENMNVLTHCNAGALATAGTGRLWVSSVLRSKMEK